MMKEVFQYLGQARHEKAEKALLGFLDGVERALRTEGLDAEDRQALTIQADRVVRRPGEGRHRGRPRGGGRARPSENPALGDTLSRLGELGRQDLSSTPAIASRLIEAIRADLRAGC
jgi:hypothetical protein